jgi:DNA-binding CsgD family transcriptional regulator
VGDVVGDCAAGATTRHGVGRSRAEEPSWQDTAARLRKIPIERLETLREREQLAVRLYYALDGGPAIPPTLKELASRIGVHAARSAQQIVGRAVAALLDPAAADPTGADVFACTVCGKQAYRPIKGSAHACSDACLLELRRRSRKRQVVRELSSLEPFCCALEALPAAALEPLPERDRAILRMRYGLGGEAVHTQDEIADELGIKQWLVSSVVRRVTARLLGWQAIDPAGRHRVRCAVCGAPAYVQRPTRGGTPACGPACAKELRSRRARARRRARQAALLAPVRDLLRTLSADAFGQLGERDRAIVRRYYGLEDGIFHTQYELAEEHGVNETTVGAIVRGAAAVACPNAPLGPLNGS